MTAKTLTVKNKDWVDLAKGYATDSLGGDRLDFFVRILDDPNVLELFSASDTAAFARVDGDVSKQSCFTALSSRQDRGIKAIPELIGRWVCVRTWDNALAAIRIDKVDPAAGALDLSYVVWN